MQSTTSTKEPPFEGIRRFFRNVIAELKKVNWPSRKELITYTIVVILTVLAVATIIAIWDWLFVIIFKLLRIYR